MVLLNHVVQVLALTHPATTAYRPVLFQLLDCDRIGRVPIHVDDARLNVGRSKEQLAEEGLAEAASRLAVSKKSMVCRPNPPRDTDIGLGLSPCIRFVDSIRLVGRLQVGTAELSPSPSLE